MGLTSGLKTTHKGKSKGRNDNGNKKKGDGGRFKDGG